MDADKVREQDAVTLQALSEKAPDWVSKKDAKRVIDYPKTLPENTKTK